MVWLLVALQGPGHDGRRVDGELSRLDQERPGGSMGVRRLHPAEIEEAIAANEVEESEEDAEELERQVANARARIAAGGGVEEPDESFLTPEEAAEFRRPPPPAARRRRDRAEGAQNRGRGS